jgi:non-homologous end joining protein Ku
VALFPATTARDRIRFNVINRKIGHRVRCAAGRKKLERAS